MTDLPRLQLKPLRAGYGFELSQGLLVQTLKWAYHANA